MRRFMCRLLGHRWRYRYRPSQGVLSHHECLRCGARVGGCPGRWQRVRATVPEDNVIEFPTVKFADAANVESGRIPVTRNLVMDAVEKVMLTEDRPAFRPGGALSEAGRSGVVYEERGGG